MRLKDKVAVVVGGGQTPGDTIGNGRATAILFAREGARVVVVDRDLARARDTEAAIRAEGGAATALEADVTREADCMRLARTVVETHGRIDVLHNNVGIGGGARKVRRCWEEGCGTHHDGERQRALPHLQARGAVMRAQMSSSIVNISSIAAVCAVGIIAYRARRPRSTPSPTRWRWAMRATASAST
jgi:NAD(P)-dependent dehydrogenase (short-subunit alcohol dehydrogenase family)